MTSERLRRPPSSDVPEFGGGITGTGNEDVLVGTERKAGRKIKDK